MQFLSFPSCNSMAFVRVHSLENLLWQEVKSFSAASVVSIGKWESIAMRL